MGGYQHPHADFPGNVRELRNLIERAYILSAGETLSPESFAVPQATSPSAGVRGPAECRTCPALQAPPEGFDLPGFLEEIEWTLIGNVLAAAGGTQVESARKLGLSSSVLSYKVAKHAAKGEA